MLAVLEFYVSGFWTWLGLTIGLGIVVQGLFLIVAAIVERRE